MGVIHLPSETNTQEISVNGIYGFVASGTTLILEGSTPAGWNLTPIIEETPYRRKVLFMRNDKKAIIRYEIDKEGPHAHYDRNGYEVKIHIPESNEMTLWDFVLKVQEFKEKGNGIINCLRRKKDKPSE